MMAQAEPVRSYHCLKMDEVQPEERRMEMDGMYAAKTV